VSNIRTLIVSLGLATTVAAVALVPTVATVSAQADPYVFPDTGFSITDGAIASFFDRYGGVGTFGEPISREFTLSNTPTQLFQDAALQVLPDGSVAPLALTSSNVLPSPNFNGLTVPSADAAMAFVAPTPDQPNYEARVQVFVQSTIPQPFLDAYTNSGGAAVWGLPTSGAATDPNNPSFSYQRFQNGILFHDATADTTTALPLGEQLKTTLQHQGVTDAFTPDTLAASDSAAPEGDR
jgi:hypothetical protein